MLIYAYRNKTNGKVYIGKTAFTLKKRHTEHLRDVRYGSRTYFHNALRKYGEAKFELFVVFRASSIAELDQMETHFVRQYHSDDPKLGYNLTSGGDGGVPTEAVRAKLRAARKGRPSPAKGKRWSAESRKRKSQSMLGIRPPNVPPGPLSEDWKRNISKGLTGLAKPQSQRDKIRRARQGTKLVVLDGVKRFVK